MKNSHKQANKMFCVSFVLMKLKSHFIGFPDERSLQRLSVKNTRTFHSLPLYPIVVCICVCSLSRLSQIGLNAKIRNVCELSFLLAPIPRYLSFRPKPHLGPRYLSFRPKPHLGACSQAKIF